MFIDGYIAISVIIVVASGWMMGYRNYKGLSYLLKISNNVYEASRVDIAEGRDFKWRYAELNKLNYNKLVFTFWKPISKVYPNIDYIWKI